MRTNRLRFTAAATLAMSVFAGVGLSAAADPTWTVTFVTANLPAGGRTIAATTDFVANVGAVVVQDSLTPTPAGWSLKVNLLDGTFTEVCVPNAVPANSTCVNGAAAAATFTATTATVASVGTITPVLSTTAPVVSLLSVSSVLVNPATVSPITSAVALTTSQVTIATATYANATTAAVALYPATVTLGLNQATELANANFASNDYIGASFVETVVYTLVP